MIKKDLIGRNVSVVSASNQSLQALKGECVDETKHTLRIRTDRGEKTVLKNQATFDVAGYAIAGNILIGRPHERTKRKVTRWQKRINK